ncbi:hypothetical protein LEP1GSC073_3956 [Leptospira noguchii str. Cascata]|nr:hypothetical protein LEP1GSC073_3956 [Leptospira noguchii str. Cascata]
MEFFNNSIFKNILCSQNLNYYNLLMYFFIPEKERQIYE